MPPGEGRLPGPAGDIFCDAKDSLLRLHGRDWTAALAMDSNVWFQREGPLLLWGRETVGADRFTAFMKGRGLEAHGLVADPRFVDPARNDCRLAPDSPARAISDGGLPPGALP